jgi:tetratricopeptide (TPR) repeat protein
MTTSRHHQDTEARPTGLDARMQDALDWVADHRREAAIALGVLMACVVLAAALWELSRSRNSAASAELAALEADFVADMGSDRTAALVTEPANPEQATRAREAALGKFEAFAQSHSGPAAATARLRAAELEVDLGRLDAADARLLALIGELGDKDPRKGIALRLRGYVLEQLERPAEAAALYETGGALESYPPRALLWIAAAHTHMRLGENESALRAFDRAIEAEPELASDPRIERERREVQAMISQPPAPAATAPTP